MSTAALVSFRTPALAWTDAPDDTRLFRRITSAVLAITATLCVMLLLTPALKPQQSQAPAVPAPMAKLLLEHTPAPLPELPKAELERKPEVKPEVEPPPTKTHESAKVVPQKKAPPAREPAPTAAVVTAAPGGSAGAQQNSVEAARKRVAGLGLLAASEDIAQVRTDAAVTVRTDIRQRSGVGAASGGAAANDSVSLARAMVTTNSSGGSSSISAPAYNRSAAASGGGGVGLAARSVTIVEDNSAKLAAAASAKRLAAVANTKPQRSLEDIRQVLARHKGALDAIYNRALREDPTLQGKVVVEIKIAPSGEVLACKVAFSDLHDPALEAKLVARIRMIDFGAKDVDVTTEKYPLDFLPS
ncbi:MAG: AgmX/PglI C-terminal domain-containing protein [Burkholderiales bacterium]|nr:AgmX/PglI C-terminal domain-containing protein [Burkholderiales bacterium]